jgi:hypothetical protein
MTATLDTESACAAAIRSVTDAARPVGLDEVLQRAALQDRLDTKYLVDADAYTAWAELLHTDLDVLGIDNRREFAYESTYFDTPDRALFRDHRQGRRRRYKIRTRSYLDTAACHLEVKLDGGRGATLKERAAYPLTDRSRLTPNARRHLTTVLRRHAHVPPADLVAALTNRYRRSTLLLRHAPVRITCDTGLRWTNPASTVTAPDRYILVEIKADGPRNPATAAFSRIGVRPVSISKYCAGIALLETWQHANPWRPVLARYLLEPRRDTSHPSRHPFSAQRPGYPTTNPRR